MPNTLSRTILAVFLLCCTLTACDTQTNEGSGADGAALPETEPPTAPTEEAAISFDHHVPGDLIAGSGTGYAEDHVFVPGMRYPVEISPSFPNSQVYNPGGSEGPGGGQCEASNYDYPWRDNFCETRGYTTPMCPAGTGHQGQDIRPPSCEKSKYWAVAAEAGTITAIGSYSVTLTADSGTIYRYLHLDMKQLPVSVGQHLERGARMGLVSNDFNDTPTTIHLHFEIKQNIALSDGSSTITFVPPYTSLVESYEALLSGTP